MTGRRLCLGVDIEGFSARAQWDARVDLQRRLHWLMICALKSAGIALDRCGSQPLGDGLLVMLPAKASEVATLPRLVAAMNTHLQAINSAPGSGGAMRLRVAASSGVLGRRTYLGHPGDVLIETSALLDSAIAREALAGNRPEDAILIVAEHLAESLRQRPEGLDFGAAEIVTVEKKAASWRAVFYRRLPVLAIRGTCYSGQLDGVGRQGDGRRLWFLASALIGTAVGGTIEIWAPPAERSDEGDDRPGAEPGPGDGEGIEDEELDDGELDDGVLV